MVEGAVLDEEGKGVVGRGLNYGGEAGVSLVASVSRAVKSVPPCLAKASEDLTLDVYDVDEVGGGGFSWAAYDSCKYGGVCSI